MTLREQIKSIHAKNFNKEFHEYRQDLIPAMVNDLAEKLFDDLLHSQVLKEVGVNLPPFYYLPDTADLRAVRQARVLVKAMKLREDTPAVE